MACVLRMLARNLLPSPSPFDAPLTSPAISTISMVVGITRLGLSISASRTSRRSGTVITPTLGSMVQKGKFAACAFALDRQLKRVDLPTFGRPTMPHCKAIELSCLFRIGCLRPGAFRTDGGCRVSGIFRASCTAGGAGDGCCVSCALSVCGRRFACVQHPLRVLRGRRRCCPAASGGNSPAGRSAKILISFHICIGSLSDDEKYCSGLGAVCGAGVYYRERSGRPLVSVRKFLFPIRCFSEYFYFLCINH